jgi:hypothetical protein
VAIVTGSQIVDTAPRGTAERALMIVFAVVCVVSTSAGVTMLSRPGDTDSNFAWVLRPEPLAGLVGGLYIAAGVFFGWGAVVRWPQQRGVLVGVLALTVPTFIVTLVHEQVFDFSRFFALFWLFLFFAAPSAAAILLYLLRGNGVAGGGTALPQGLRTWLGALAAVYLVAAIALFADPGGVGERMPFALPDMGGRFLGAFALALAVLAAWPALRGRAESSLPLLGTVAFPLGGLLAAVRHLDDLEPAGRRTAWFIVLIGLAAAGAVAIAWERRSTGG